MSIGDYTSKRKTKVIRANYLNANEKLSSYEEVWRIGGIAPRIPHLGGKLHYPAALAPCQ
jgi:hypothetical protein